MINYVNFICYDEFRSWRVTYFLTSLIQYGARGNNLVGPHFSYCLVLLLLEKYNATKQKLIQLVQRVPKHLSRLRSHEGTYTCTREDLYNAPDIAV